MQIEQSFSLQFGLLVSFHGDSVFESLFSSLRAIDVRPVIEVDVEATGLAAVASQFHLNRLQIALPPIQGFEEEPDRPFLATVVGVEIRTVQTWLFKVGLVDIRQVL